MWHQPLKWLRNGGSVLVPIAPSAEQRRRAVRSSPLRQVPPRALRHQRDLRHQWVQCGHEGFTVTTMNPMTWCFVRPYRLACAAARTDPATSASEP